MFEDCRVKALAAALREGEGGARDVAALARTRDMEGASAKRRGAYSPWGLVSAGAERATLESQLRGALRALGDHIEPGTDAARILEELGGDLDSVDQLHSQGMELAEVDADEEGEELMGPAALCPRCGQQQVDCICAPSRPVAQEPEGEWEPGMGLGGGAAVLEGPPPCPLMQRAIELGVLGLSTRYRKPADWAFDFSIDSSFG